MEKMEFNSTKRLYMGIICKFGEGVDKILGIRTSYINVCARFLMHFRFSSMK